MRRLITVLALSTLGCLLLASCSESDELGDAVSEDDGSATEDDSGDDSGGSDDDLADAVTLLEGEGFSTELAECAVDSLVDQGIEPSELDGIAFPDEELSTALALAGAECSEFADGLPEGVLDLEDPAVRRGLITSFSATSGLSEGVAECVLDYLVDEGVEGEELLGESASGVLSPELEQVVADGVAACS